MKWIDLASVALESTAKRKWTALLVFVGLLPGLCLMYASLLLYNNSSFFQKTIREMIAVSTDSLICVDIGSGVLLEDEADSMVATFLDDLKQLSCVESCGALFSAMASLDGLAENAQLKLINRESGDAVLEKYSGSVMVVYADKVLLGYCGIDCGREYEKALADGEIPVIVGAAYRDCFEQAGTFTHRGTTYRIVGFLDKGTKLFGDNGILLSYAGYTELDYRLVLPRPEIVTAECYLHSIYCVARDSVTSSECSLAIKETAAKHGMMVMVSTAGEKITDWEETDDEGKKEITGLALLMLCVSILSQITIGLVVALLRKKEFGILIVNGVSQREIALSTAMGTTVRGVLAFFVAKWFTERYYIRIRKVTDPSVLSTSLLQYAVLTVIVVVLIIAALSLYLCRRMPKEFLDDEV